MPFKIPSLQQLIDQSQSDIESNLPGAYARLKNKVLNIIALVQAYNTKALHDYQFYLSKQFFADTSEKEFLERDASLFGVQRKKAQFASGFVIFTGNDSVIIDVATLLQRPDGLRYITTAEGVITAGIATIAVKAESEGKNSNYDAAAPLLLVVSIDGVDATALVNANGLTNGSDVESDDSLRERLLYRKRNPPHGGALHDYIAWAREVPGVSKAWAFSLYNGLGTVGVTFIVDDADVIPDAAKVLQVMAYIESHINPVSGIEEGRPVTANVLVFAPTAKPLNPIIQLTPATDAVKTTVTTELNDLLLREAAPEATILLSHMREAVSIAAGETDHVLSAPAANVTHTKTEIPVLGVITWL